MSGTDPAPDLSRLTSEELAKILVEGGALARLEQEERATTTTEALGGLCGVGFDVQPEPDAVIEPDAQNLP